MHKTGRNWSEWYGEDEKRRDGKGKNMQGSVGGWGGGEGGDNVKESSTSERRRKSHDERRGGIAWGLRGGIKYFNHRLSCCKNAFDPDSKALL